MTNEEAEARFGSLLLDVLGDKSREISPDLRGRLRVFWREGMKDGLRLEREREPVPSDVFEGWESRRVTDKGTLTFELGRAPGKYAELQDAKVELVRQIEDLAILVEHEITPERTLGVGGVDLVKARHLYLTRIQQVARGVTRLAEMVAKFRE